MERYFEDVDLGDEIGPLQREVTYNEVVEFTNLSGQGGGKPSRFTSDEQAQKEGLPGAIVPGIMSMSLLSKLLTDWADSADVKLLDVIFRQTIPHNQILKLHGIITDKGDDDGEGRVEADLYLDTDEKGHHITAKAVFTLSNKP